MYNYNQLHTLYTCMFMPPCLNYLELFNSWLCCTSISSYWWSYRSPEVSISNTEIDWLHSTCRDWSRAQRQTTLCMSSLQLVKESQETRLKEAQNFSPDMPCLGKTCRSHSIAGWFCKQVVERIGGSRYWWSHYAWIKNMRQCWSICSTSWKPALRSNGTTIRWTSFWIFLDHPSTQSCSMTSCPGKLAAAGSS
jgi:hypothetical protein